eukprot:2368522-Pyramimonas_sp.AAC.2
MRSDEYPSEWTLQYYPMSGENRAHMSAFTCMTRTQWIFDQRRCKGTHGTMLSTVPGIFGD